MTTAHVCNENEERTAYRRYVSDGLADTDGWYSPESFESWRAHYHREIGHQEPRTAECTDTECNAPQQERTRLLDHGKRRTPRFESLCPACYEPRAAVIVAAQRAARAPQRTAVPSPPAPPHERTRPMTTSPTASSPTVAIARALRRLGLAQGRGGDFRVTGEYRNGERIRTYVVTLTRHADETIAKHADDIERWVSEDGGWAFRVSIRYVGGKPRPWVDISNGPGERVRETPPAAPAGLENPADPEPAGEPEPVEESEPATVPVEDPQDLRLQRAQAAALGWSTGQADLVASAAAGQLQRHSDGTLREVPVPGLPGRIVASHRLPPLVKAGFLTIGEPDDMERRPIHVTTDGRRAITVWRRWKPRPVEKNRTEEYEALQPLFRGEQAARLTRRAREEEEKTKAATAVFWEAAERLRAWEDREDRLWEVWAKVNGIRFRLQRRPADWLPTEEEIAEHFLDPEVVAELRAEVANPRPKPELPSVRSAPPEELPPLEADARTPEQLDLFGAVLAPGAPDLRFLRSSFTKSTC
ncbi:hypothetical protein [Streptomyces canus]|uniref:hypothetical protein n=1 Tax=Streptomyces canus TaxID=58343 RepID=UPI0030E471B7